eukprot:1350192-Amphidinium_carterae.1
MRLSESNSTLCSFLCEWRLQDTYEEKAGELTDRMVRRCRSVPTPHVSCNPMFIPDGGLLECMLRKSMDLKRRLSPVAARVGSTLATSPSGIGGPASPVRKPI